MAAPARAAAPMFRALRRYPRTMLLPDFRGNIAANGKPQCIMPLGVEYFCIILRFTIAGVPATEAQIKAQIASFNAFMDGDDKLANASPTELLGINNFWNSRYGLTNVNDGCLRIGCTRPWEQEIDAQDGPGWGCATNVPGGVGNFTLVVNMAAAAVTIDGIEGHAEYGRAAPLGRHWKLRRYQDNQAAAGEKVFSDFVQQADVAAYAFHIDKASTPEGGALIDHVALKVDQADEFQKIPCGQLENRYRRYGCVKQTGFTHIPFDVRGRPLEAMPFVAQDMRLSLFTTGGALGNYNILSENMEGVDPAPAAAAG